MSPVVGSEAVVTQVLDELGIELSGKLTDLPTATGSLSTPQAAGNKAEALDSEASLAARLDNLRRE